MAHEGGLRLVVHGKIAGIASRLRPCGRYSPPIPRRYPAERYEAPKPMRSLTRKWALMSNWKGAPLMYLSSVGGPGISSCCRTAPGNRHAKTSYRFWWLASMRRMRPPVAFSRLSLRMLFAPRAQIKIVAEIVRSPARTVGEAYDTRWKRYRHPATLFNCEKSEFTYLHPTDMPEDR